MGEIVRSESLIEFFFSNIFISADVDEFFHAGMDREIHHIFFFRLSYKPLFGFHTFSN